MFDRCSVYPHAAFVAVIIHMLPVQAAKADCQSSILDFIASVQEVLVLMVAFVLGWYLIGPLMALLTKGYPARRTASNDNAQNNSVSSKVQPGRTCSLKTDDEESVDLVGKNVESQGRPSRPRSHSSVTDSSAADNARAHGRTGRPDLAVDMWLAAAEEAGFEADASLLDGFPEPALYSAALEACARCKDFESAHRLACRAAFFAPPGHAGQASLLSLARWLARRHDLASARQCVEAVQRSGGKVDRRTLKALIVVCAQGGNMEMGSTYFEQLMSESIAPDFATFSAMIRGFCNASRTEEALSHLELMLKHDLHPDAMLFDALIESCALRNLLAPAEQALLIMQKLAVQPSNCTLAACIKLYSSRGELSRAVTVFEDMPKQFGFEPNSYVHGALISACFRNGRPDLALKSFENMSSQGCTPSAQTYEYLVQCCLSLGDLNKAMSLVDEALCLRQSGEADQSPAIDVRRVSIEPKVVEDLLSLIGRRREATKLGVPLLQRLAAANIPIAERVSDSILRAAALEAGHAASPATQCQRRAEFNCWRNFALMPATDSS
eukprot:gb/GFBE01018024.1/.p1 GENE.gb/GFBE01018024.1/~~gb/GFBE01018024.1/.p1  ORF type:complete len:554 (+),score=106.56 gb/GFBE01018024.1/:1-1662(+)